MAHLERLGQFQQDDEERLEAVVVERGDERLEALVAQCVEDASHDLRQDVQSKPQTLQQEPDDEEDEHADN